jgi:hypothetical protein
MLASFDTTRAVHLAYMTFWRPSNVHPGTEQARLFRLRLSDFDTPSYCVTIGTAAERAIKEQTHEHESG